MDLVRALDASSRGDAVAFMAALDPQIEWTPVKEDPDYRVHRDLDDVKTWLAEWAEVFPDMRWEAERILDAGGVEVVALVRALGRDDATGADVGSQVYGVIFTVRSGKIVRIDESQSETALKAVRPVEQAMSANLDLVRSIYAAWARCQVKTECMPSSRFPVIDAARAAAERLAGERG